jgi:hypothetical protein
MFGSGEADPSSGKAYEHLAKQLGKDLHISILETPAGFELNSSKVAGNIRDFLLKRLQNYNPHISLIPARKKSTPLSPDNPVILEPILRSNWLLMGPGSPTYTVRQLKDSTAFDYIMTSHMLGSALTFASAALLAVSKFTLPVYEIYKVGEDLHWVDGIDYFSLFGLNLVFVPHWNNCDGGSDLDTSYCYMGKERFDKLIKMLPPEITVIGLDEQTALFFEFGPPCTCQVFGKGKVTILNGGQERRITSGQSFNLSNFDEFSIPNIDQIVSKELMDRFNSAKLISAPKPDRQITALVKSREIARENEDWRRADQLRDQLLSYGWEVRDTSNGPELNPLV